MARFKDHQKALELRKQGMSYSQIKKILNVSKSVLSYWLKNFPLSKERIRELRDRNEQRIERFRETMKQKKEKRLREVYEMQKQIILPLNNRELFIAGLFLYWGEGSKMKTATLEMANTDPCVIKFFIRWLNQCFGIAISKIRIDLHLYEDMNIAQEINYWSSVLKISSSQFSKPFIKKSSSTSINHKGSFGHGTCKARLGGVKFLEKTLMSIKVLADRYAK